MTRKRKSEASAEAAALRQRAEKRIASQSAKHGRAIGDGDARRLIHELEIHQAELELQNEELRIARLEVEAGLSRYTELFDFAPIGYFSLDSDGFIRQVNHAGARLLGLPRATVLGRCLRLFVANRDQATFDVFLSQALAHAEDEVCTASCELGLERESLGLVDVRITGALLQGSALAALLAVEDISARKRAEAEVREESRHKDDFLAALSHELRNPLAPIRNSLYILERTAPDGEKPRKALATVERQVAHLTRIVDDLLDVTRIARGKIRLQRDRIELGELVLRTMDDHRASFEAAGIKVDGDLGPDPLWIDADPTRLVQVLGNLLANAAKFSRRGDRVLVSLQRVDRHVELRVSDTGAGIAPDVQKRLFEPFRQAPQTLDRAGGGVGLGLAMVKGLVELHGGTVRATSAGIGKGSEFCIELPLVERPSTVASPAAPRAQRHFRVMIVEDNVDAAASLQDVLEYCGHEVQVASDGPSGVALARQFRPQIVICDIGLPGMNGYEVAKSLRADEALGGIRLIALTGYAQPDDAQRALEAGFDDHIAKPATLERLEQLFQTTESTRS